MLISFARWFIGLIVTLATILFAVANRGPATVIWSPVNAPATIPVYALALGGAVIGFLAGTALVWLNAGAFRRERRQQKKRISRLEQRLEDAGHGDELED